MYASELANRYANKSKPIGGSSEEQMNRVKRSVLSYLYKGDICKTKLIDLENFLFQLRSLGIEVTEASLDTLRQSGPQVDYEKTLEDFRYDIHSGKWSIPLDNKEVSGELPARFFQESVEVSEDIEGILLRMEDRFQRL